MFPVRFFAPRYWAERFWPSTGETQIDVQPITVNAEAVVRVSEATTLRDTIIDYLQLVAGGNLSLIGGGSLELSGSFTSARTVESSKVNRLVQGQKVRK